MNNAKFITLNNGLTVLIYSDKTKISNHIELITFLGGKSLYYIDESGNYNNILPGSAHFLEHFICEKNINGDLINNLRGMECLGVNASTDNYVTSFYADMVDNFDQCLEMFLNSIYNPVFNKINVCDTRYAILNEIRDDNDNFRRKISYRILNNVFYNHVKTLGNKTSVNRINSKYLKKLYECTYVPKNQFLVLAGCFDEDKVLNYVNDFYNNISFRCNRRLLSSDEKEEVVKKNDVFISNINNEVIISFKIDIGYLSDFEKYKLDWYLGAFSLINFSKYSNINDFISNSSDYMGDISYSKSNFGNYVLFEVAVYTDKCDMFKNLVITTINNFRNNTKEEFDYYKKHCKTNVSVRKDSINMYVSPIAQNYIEFNYPYDDTIDFIDSLSYDDYIDMIGNLNFSNYSCMFIKKRK
ncbi:MAG: M16 family metallopeptidase [Bacilli bacterium]